MNRQIAENIIHTSNTHSFEDLVTLVLYVAEFTRKEEQERCANICRKNKPWGNMSDDYAAKLLEECACKIEKGI